MKGKRKITGVAAFLGSAAVIENPETLKYAVVIAGGYLLIQGLIDLVEMYKWGKGNNEQSD